MNYQRENHYLKHLLSSGLKRHREKLFRRERGTEILWKSKSKHEKIILKIKESQRKSENRKTIKSTTIARKPKGTQTKIGKIN